MNKSFILPLFATVVVFAQSGKETPEEKIATYTEAVRINPDDAVAHFYCGFAYYGKGDYTRARADWEKVSVINFRGLLS
jgi:cytochrome c-type biogenesis protein CcmH/NrfG